MAIVLANADGTVYHRYGGRDDVSPMNVDTLIEIMHEGLATHRAYVERPAPPTVRPAQRVRELVDELLTERENPIYGCYHCHYVREARQFQAVKARTWTPDRFWIWPSPARLGLVLNQLDQNLVDDVVAGSPAAAAGILPGDEVSRLAERRVLTKYDVQWVLEKSPSTATELGYTVTRAGASIDGTLALEDGWKVGDPRDYSWRIDNVYTEHMRRFLPTPGFVGASLGPAKRAALGIAPDDFALEVSLLNYGTHLAGVRVGDVILGVDGRSDFNDLRGFYHRCEMLRRSGRDLTLTLLRRDSPMRIVVSSNHLNYANVEESPEVMLGFTPQQLGGGGMRVGLVVDDSSAERAGLRHGDLLLRMDGEPVATYDEVQSILADKMPGDILTVNVRRLREDLLFAYVLVDKEGRESSLARLDQAVTTTGQEIECEVSIRVPEGKHIYGLRKQAQVLPTRLEFRGSGYELVGIPREPEPQRHVSPGLDDLWVHSGTVRFQQKIRVTDAGRFRLLLRVYAQVCDDRRCHEFRASAINKGLSEQFEEYRGRFDSEPRVN